MNQQIEFRKLSPLETERLTLRLLKKTDVAEIFKLRSDKKVSHYTARPVQKKLSEAEEFIDFIKEGIHNNEYIYLAITTKESPKLIGTICLWNFSEDKKVAELGYELLPSFQGRGIMDEALKRLVKFGFSTLKLDKIEAFTHKENAASLKLLVNNKFVHEVGRKDKGFPNNIIYFLTDSNLSF